MGAASVGEEVGVLQDTILGLQIALGNQLVALVIDYVADEFVFLEKDMREVVTMGLAFLATLINGAFDFALVLLIMDDVDPSMFLRGEQDHSNYDIQIARELFSLIVPGYLITPYLLAPLAEYFL